MFHMAILTYLYIWKHINILFHIFGNMYGMKIFKYMELMIHIYVSRIFPYIILYMEYLVFHIYGI